MTKPGYITFTGVDAYTDMQRLYALSLKYAGRVEWGVLFSDKQRARGNLRYPPDLLVKNLRNKGLHLAAHICGRYADLVNTGQFFPIDYYGFGRVQVNHSKPNIEVLNDFSDKIDATVIAQSRDPNGFGMGGNVVWLYDPSGGRGERPEQLPEALGCVPVGYAGGINPENVLEVISNIEAKNYWIDMETGVRNEHDLFDLDKCEAVLKAVYPDDDNTCRPDGDSDV